MSRANVNSNRWEQVSDVLSQALGLSPTERAAYLDRVCGADAELRREVEALLDHDEQSGDILDLPGQPATPLVAGGRIGPYEVQRLLGVGGMGAVYLCARVDDGYRHQVAIKLLQPGMASPQVTRRFRSERRILSSLQHPNIARLFDGGVTAQGEPYFVMEYVEGDPIDVYCERTNASIGERVDVFCRVCDAVQAAHRALVVHRDIKPGNILVHGDGTPKLLDFGIAKMLTAEPGVDVAEQTIAGLRLMTPAYASPEQIRGEPVTTATDIYSLGVVLYKLLVGALPHRSATASAVEIEREICDVDPEPPGRVTGGRIDRDLSAIVMKALRKEPAERYGSVEQLSADLQRYRHGYPVIARRGNTAYHVGKFLRRNRTATAAAALVVLSLAGGIAASSWQASVARAERREAEAQRQLAERRFAEVRRLANSFLFEFDTAIADLAGATAARQLVVSKALEYLSALAKDAHGDPQLLWELATAYQRVGDIQGHPFFANLGDRAGALRSYREALRIWESIAARPGSATDAVVQAAFVHRVIGDVLSGDTRNAEALAEYRLAFETLDRVRSGMSEKYVDAARSERITLMGRLGTQLALVGQVAEGVRWCERAVDEGRATLRSGRLDEKHELSVLYSRAGKALLQAGAIDAAAVLHREEIAVSEALAAEAPPAANAHYRRDVALAYRSLADIHLVRQDLAAALALDERARTIQESILGADSANSQMRKELAGTYAAIGGLLMRQSKLAAAEQTLARALRLGERLLKDDATSRAYRLTYADGLGQMGALCRQRGQSADARRHYRTRIEVLEPLDASGDRGVRQQLLDSYRALAALEPDPAAASAYSSKASALERALGEGAATPAGRLHGPSESLD